MLHEIYVIVNKRKTSLHIFLPVQNCANKIWHSAPGPIILGFALSKPWMGWGGGGATGSLSLSQVGGVGFWP